MGVIFMMHKKIIGIRKNAKDEIELDTTIVYKSENDLRNLRNYAEQRVLSLRERIRQTQEQLSDAERELVEFEDALEVFKKSSI
jgi:hypothetical protein